MKVVAIILGVVFPFTALPTQAQETIDVAKITCEQYIGNDVINPDKISIWLSGYYNAKLGNTTVEVQEFRTNVRKLEDYCLHHRQMRVMQAFEETFKMAKK
jgi:HdeA/HdeB family